MSSLYLIQGDDEFTKTHELEKIKSQFNNLQKGINFLQFDKDNLPLLGAELTTYSFFQEPKLIVVKVPPSTRKSAGEDDEVDEEDNQKKAKDWYTEELEEQILNKIDNILLVFYEESSSKGKLFKLVSKYGIVINCEKEKPQGLANWAVTYANSLSLKLQRQDATYLAEVCGNNKQYMANEINKLYDYLGDNKEIKKEIIDLICTRTPEVIIFELTDSIGTKNKVKALNFLDELLDNKETIQKIAIMISKHFKNLMLAKFCKEQGKSVEKELGVKSYPAMKYTNQASNFTKAELVNIFMQFVKLDLNSKIGNIDLKVGLQKILLT